MLRQYQGWCQGEEDSQRALGSVCHLLDRLRMLEPGHEQVRYKCNMFTFNNEEVALMLHHSSRNDLRKHGHLGSIN